MNKTVTTVNSGPVKYVVSYNGDTFSISVYVQYSDNEVIEDGISTIYEAVIRLNEYLICRKEFNERNLLRSNRKYEHTIALDITDDDLYRVYDYKKKGNKLNPVSYDCLVEAMIDYSKRVKNLNDW